MLAWPDNAGPSSRTQVEPKIEPNVSGIRDGVSCQPRSSQIPNTIVEHTFINKLLVFTLTSPRNGVRRSRRPLWSRAPAVATLELLRHGPRTILFRSCAAQQPQDTVIWKREMAERTRKHHEVLTLPPQHLPHAVPCGVLCHGVGHVDQRGTVYNSSVPLCLY